MGIGSMADPTELLDTRSHMQTGGWAIINGKGEILAVTMLSPLSVIMNEAPGNTQTERLRWVIETGQVLPPERWQTDRQSDYRVRIVPLHDGAWMRD
jgi:hypothetical protein